MLGGAGGASEEECFLLFLLLFLLDRRSSTRDLDHSQSSSEAFTSTRDLDRRSVIIVSEMMSVVTASVYAVSFPVADILSFLFQKKEALDDADLVDTGVDFGDFPEGPPTEVIDFCVPIGDAEEELERSISRRIFQSRSCRVSLIAPLQIGDCLPTPTGTLMTSPCTLSDDTVSFKIAASPPPISARAIVVSAISREALGFEAAISRIHGDVGEFQVWKSSNHRCLENSKVW